MECGDAALYAAGFFRVEILVCFGKKLLDPLAIPAVNRDADAGRETGLLLVLGHDDANAIGDVLGFRVLRLWQYESELIAAIARGGVNRAAVNAQDGRQAAKSAAADQVAEAVVDFFQAVEIEEQNGEGPAGAVGALGFIFEDVEEAAVIGEPGERVADSEMADLFKEPRVIEKRPAERDGVTADSKDLGEHKRRVEKALRLARGELGGEVHPSGGVDGAVEGGVFGIKAAAIPNHGRKKNDSGQKLLRAGHEGAGMAGDLRRKPAKSRGDQIGETDHRQQSAGDFPFRVPRTRDEAFHEKGDKEQQRQSHAAEPPSDRRPGGSRGSVLRELEEENAGGREHGARKKIAAAKNQRDAILGALEADERQRGENERQERGDDLEIALENGIRFERDRPQPVGDEKGEQEAQHMPQDNLGGTATDHAYFLVHTRGPRLGRGAT